MKAKCVVCRAPRGPSIDCLCRACERSFDQTRHNTVDGQATISTAIEWAAKRTRNVERRVRK